ncbi:hypothetical protein QFC19_007274 [Naganishia cerealis]|uniref:Uncharacterized protein n=1 Tax=Naganishia cerealis TaxID=610337 RepID=A0ACC2V9X4_9TREE|nr:hypothetical protein QFC19_007274 [Naganishia cerealis]
MLPLPYYNDDPKSFAYPTVHKRWPTIIEGCIEDIKKEIDNNSTLQSSGEKLIDFFKQLLDDFKSDKVVEPFDETSKGTPKEILARYNKSLRRLNEMKKVTWLTGPWLYLECYLYQWIHLQMWSSDESHWHTYDIFERLKTETFRQSSDGVIELCKLYQKLNGEINTGNLDEDAFKLVFKELIDVSLWGNATDLSLLAGNVTADDIKSVQGAEARKKNEKNILVNDFESAWAHLKSSKSQRIDFVLDNSGFELFTDLVLALFALDSGLVQEIDIHCKEIPWFVSDTMPKDFDALVSQLEDPSFFKELHGDEALTKFSSALKKYYKDGKIRVQSHPFWTTDANFWDIVREDDLFAELKKSDLIIFKGDLNYRKLTGDIHWDKTTPFRTAIQDLATSGLPILSLRTCKADVVVGLPQGVDEQLIETYKSMGNEVGEFWSSSGKWAVVSFNK